MSVDGWRRVERGRVMEGWLNKRVRGKAWWDEGKEVREEVNEVQKGIMCMYVC